MVGYFEYSCIDALIVGFDIGTINSDSPITTIISLIAIALPGCFGMILISLINSLKEKPKCL